MPISWKTAFEETTCFENRQWLPVGGIPVCRCGRAAVPLGAGCTARNRDRLPGPYNRRTDLHRSGNHPRDTEFLMGRHHILQEEKMRNIL